MSYVELTLHKVVGDDSPLTIHTTDEPNKAGANNRYEIGGFNALTNDSVEEGDPVRFLPILFQSGFPPEKGFNGVTMEVLLAIVQHRLNALQLGDFHCLENGVALVHVSSALEALNARTEARIERGVKDKPVV